MPGYRVPTIVFLSLLSLALPASADETTDSIRKVISSQIAAFIDEDASKAFSFAAPALQKRFGDPRVFVEMVRKSYGAILRPGAYAFGKSHVDDDKSHAFQVVLISEPDGKEWAALYEMERQTDGRYAISGVRIMRDSVSKGI
ncbi:DUF4864 domain-containing protein [Agrobacterium sp. ES01]|uniref:DUF4864 domain-containing protein n=1 Tax=Agrobacterium sp. ES01 TaxID=3420714 RepID=UPI003D0E05F9